MVLRKYLKRNTRWSILLPFIGFAALVLIFRNVSSSITVSSTFPRDGGHPQNRIHRAVVKMSAGLFKEHSSPMYKCSNVEIDEVNSSKKLHTYKDEAHLRVIVLTFDRYKSLKKVLDSLQDLVLDGHNATLEIWIDRNKENHLDGDTYRTARSFCWDKGPVYVHIHSNHVGIYGQWIRTWKPQRKSSLSEDELAIIIEDDVDISKYAYRWLRRAHQVYGDQDEISGYSLQDENVKFARGPKKGKEIPKYDKGLIYLFPISGSWGFAPHPARWNEFQNWYLKKSSEKSFKPYVPDAQLHTEWYKTFEKKHKADTMWTMWFIRFCFERSLYSIYSNIPTFFNLTDGSLVSNRKEAGLHYLEKKRHMYKIPKLMHLWNDKYSTFPAYNNIKRYDYDGSIVGEPLKLGGIE